MPDDVREGDLFPAETQSRREEELEVIFCCFSERDKAIYEAFLGGTNHVR